MGFATDIETIASARRKHRCSWCNERINVGEKYLRYRWYDSGDAATVKLHEECNSAMSEFIKNEGGYDIEFSPGDNPRGCICGHDIHCERCAERRKFRGEIA